MMGSDSLSFKDYSISQIIIIKSKPFAQGGLIPVCKGVHTH